MSDPTSPAPLLRYLQRLAWPLAWLERAAPVWWRVATLLLGFAAAALLQLFVLLPPWLHALALLACALWLLAEIRRALARHRPLTPAAVERWLEQRNGLPHRPFAALQSQPVNRPLDPDQQDLWRQHLAAAAAQLRNLKLLRPRFDLAARDPFALRHAALFAALTGLAFTFGAGGNPAERLYAALNPPLGAPPAPQRAIYDVWLTPPDYTRLPPVVLAKAGQNAAPAGLLKVPEGSIVTARVAAAGIAPGLRANGAWQKLAPADERTYTAAVTLHGGDAIALRKGWLTFAHWPVTIVPDRAPAVAFAAPPAVTPRKTVRFDVKADDDYGITALTAVIESAQNLPSLAAPPVTIDLPLPAPGAAMPALLSSEHDLAALPLAGMAVTVTLHAVDAAGHETAAAPVTMTLPERSFVHPLARALIGQRKILLDDADASRETAANVMATVARRPRDYDHDPVVLLALRSGAVRLLLDKSPQAIPAVTLLLWQTALRIEEGALGQAADNLQDAQEALRLALERGTGGEEIAGLVERLQAALTQYLMAMARDLAQRQSAGGEDALAMAADQMLGLDQLLALTQELGDLAATGSRDAARELLKQLQEITQNLHGSRHGLTAEQQAMLALAQNLKELQQRQKELIDRTFGAASETAVGRIARLGEELTLAQHTIRQKLGSLKSELAARAAPVPEGMTQADQAMDAALRELAQTAFKPALAFENEALIALQRLLDDARGALQAQLLLLPGALQPGGDKRDPLGRPAFGQPRDDGSVTIPDRLQTERARAILDELRARAGDGARDRTERDYIRRLLELF